MATPRLPRAPRRRAAEGLARRARQGRAARRRRRRGGARRRRREGARRRGRHATARRRSHVAEDASLEPPLPQARVDVLAKVVAGRRLRHRAVRELRARRRRRRRARGAPRRRPQLGSRRPRAAGRRARRQAPGAAGLGARRRRLDSRTPRLALFRSGSFDATPTGGGEPQVADARGRARGAFDAARRSSTSDAEESSGPSIEDADVIVAGGRGLGSPENFTLAEELARALGGAVGATRAVVDAGWYPYVGADRPDRQDRLAEALRRARHLRRDPAQGRHAELERDRRDQQGRERADLRVQRPRRRRRRARDRPEAHRARCASARADGASAPPTSRRRSTRASSSPSRPIRPTSGSRSASSSSARARRASPARSASASCSRSTRRWPSELGEVPVAVVEKGKQPGSHLLSGAVVNPRALRRLFGDRYRIEDMPALRRGARRGGLRAHAPRRAARSRRRRRCATTATSSSRSRSSAAGSPSGRRRAAR